MYTTVCENATPRRVQVAEMEFIDFQLVWWCHQLLSGFLAKGQLPECRVSHVGL